MPIIKLLSLIFSRCGLLLFGVIVTELFLRFIGLSPWEPVKRNGTKHIEMNPRSGWTMSPEINGVIWTGVKKHTETILPDRTRRVAHVPKGKIAGSVLILGDSSIYGWGLNDEETFASQLSLLSQDHLFINAAVPGYGALQSVLRMEEILPVSKPKVVILGYSEYMAQRDTGQLEWVRILSRDNPQKNVRLAYATIEGTALKINDPKPYFTELPGRETFASVRLLEEVIAAPGALIRQKKTHRITEAIFKRFADSARNFNAEPMVLFWNKDHSERLYGDYLRNIGISVLNCMHPTQGSPETIIENDGHPNEEAARFWANCVYEKYFKKPVEMCRVSLSGRG